jgi:transcriptional regulator with XRE-family HTH domain
MSTNTFGTKVKEERMRLGWSQGQLAEAVGISRNYLSQIERGEASNLSWNVMNKLAQELGIFLGEVAGITDVMESLPPSLAEFASQAELPPDDIAMLARLQYRGQRPQTAEQWKLLYKVIKGVIADE